MTARLLAAVLLALATAWVLPAPAYACSCAAKTDAEYAVQADVVFTGFIVRNDVDQEAQLRTVTFRVDRVYKGSASLTQVVTMYWDQNSCGTEFYGENPPFTVFARQERAGLTAGSCGGTVFGQVPASLGPGQPPLPDAVSPNAGRRGPSALTGRWVPLVGLFLATTAAAILGLSLVRRRPQ